MKQNTAIFTDSTEVAFGYYVFTPENLKPGAPLLVFLHGAGERGNGKDELDRVFKIALPAELKAGNLHTDAVILIPQCPENHVWNQHIHALHNLIVKIRDEYACDPDRVSVTGVSMGGFGTWEVGMTFPETFSALAPCCGGGMAWRAGALAGMPIRTFHGSADDVVSITNTREMVDAARAAGAKVDFFIFDGVGHDSWNPAYQNTDVVGWLTSQNRKDRLERK